jgi:hypothetical protein
MILIFCPECNDIVSLTDREMNYCKCKKSGGMYVTWFSAEIEGKAIALEIDGKHVQRECEQQITRIPRSVSCFIVSDVAPYITRQNLCYKCRNDQTSQLDVVDHPENSKDNSEDTQGYQIYKCRMCGEYHGCRYQYDRGSGSDNRWMMLGKDPATIKRHY